MFKHQKYGKMIVGKELWNISLCSIKEIPFAVERQITRKRNDFLIIALVVVTVCGCSKVRISLTICMNCLLL